LRLLKWEQIEGDPRPGWEPPSFKAETPDGGTVLVRVINIKEPYRYDVMGWPPSLVKAAFLINDKGEAVPRRDLPGVWFTFPTAGAAMEATERWAERRWPLQAIVAAKENPGMLRWSRERSATRTRSIEARTPDGGYIFIDAVDGQARSPRWTMAYSRPGSASVLMIRTDGTTSKSGASAPRRLFHTKEAAKRAAEVFAQSHWPLEAIVAAGKSRRNPPEIPPKVVPRLIASKDDTGAMQRAVRFLSLVHRPDQLANRLGRQPTEEEISAATEKQTRLNAMAQAGNWEGINQLLRPALSEQVVLPPGWVARLPTKKDKKSSPRPVSSRDQTAYQDLQKQAARILSGVLGPPWRRLDQETKHGLVHDVITLALESAGSLDTLRAHHLEEAATEVRKKWRGAAEKEMKFGEHIESEGGQTREEPETGGVGAADLEGLLRSLQSGTPQDQMKALLAGLHLGRPVLRGQSVRFLGPGPARDLKKHHALGASSDSSCPTCKAIARQVRGPGLTSKQVRQAVDAVLFELLRGQ
jgi:hypothetical protein